MRMIAWGITASLALVNLVYGLAALAGGATSDGVWALMWAYGLGLAASFLWED